MMETRQGQDYPEKEGLTVEIEPLEPKEELIPTVKNRLWLQVILLLLQFLLHS